MRLNCFGAAFTALLFLVVSPLANAGDQKLTLITIGSGGFSGVYYPAAGALCRLLNRKSNEHRIRCLAETSGGSVQNVRDIQSGAVDLGLVQTDIQADAIHGLGRFAESGAVSEIRSLFTVHAEPFTIVARLDSGITQFADLKGKRVSIGRAGSGSRATMEMVMQAYKMSESDMVSVPDFSVSSAQDALCENRIDAFVFVVGHPNRAVRQVSETCAVRLVEVAGKPVEALLSNHPYFLPITIQGGIYSGIQAPVKTFGVRAAVTALESLSENIAYQLTRAVLDNLEDLRRLHPAFAHLTVDEMVEGSTAPIHDGAQRFLKEFRAR